MDKIKQMPDKQYIFGALPVIANKMDKLLERVLKEYGVTSKQWLLSIVIDNLFDKPPTLKEVAKEMGSSHQNVKQVALKLQQKKLLQLVKDKKDGRVTRLKMTKESYEFWDKTEPEGDLFMEALFKNIKDEDMKSAVFVLQCMMDNLEVMENGCDEGEEEDSYGKI